MKKLFATTVPVLAAMACSFIASNTAYRPIAFGPDAQAPEPEPEADNEEPHDPEGDEKPKETKAKKKAKAKDALEEGFFLLLESNDHGASGVSHIHLFSGTADEFVEKRSVMNGKISYLSNHGTTLFAVIEQ